MFLFFKFYATIQNMLWENSQDNYKIYAIFVVLGIWLKIFHITMAAHTGGQSPKKWQVLLKTTLGNSDLGRIKQGEGTLDK